MKMLARRLLEKSAPVPILSFPGGRLTGASVKKLTTDPEAQRDCMAALAGRYPMGAVLNMMDLSVEAEAFGAHVRFEENEVPTVTEGAVSDLSAVEDLPVPPSDRGRAPVYAKGIALSKKVLSDTPVFCGCIGPYSLAGRIFDMSGLMLSCFDEPERVHILLSKATEYIVSYILLCRNAGADGVILAEPAAGLLPPELAEEFSCTYTDRIFRAVDRPDFLTVYHNCGPSVSQMTDCLCRLSADAYHFGNAVCLKELIPALPGDRIVMGNLDPLLLVYGTLEQVRKEVQKLRADCGGFPNFLLSTGCDVPYSAEPANIDAFFGL